MNQPEDDQALPEDDQSSPEGNQASPQEINPTSKVAQLRKDIYGLPKATFDIGFPKAKEIVQVWMHLIEEKKGGNSKKRLDSKTKDILLSELRDKLINHWKTQNSPIIPGEIDDAYKLKVYKEVKSLTKMYEDLSHKGFRLKKSVDNKKWLKKQKDEAEKVFEVFNVKPKKRNFEEVRRKNNTSIY